MNKLNLTNLGGMPFRQDRLKYMQDGIGNAIGAAFDAHKRQISYNVDQSAVLFHGYVLSGCDIHEDGGSLYCSAGAVFMSNEIFLVEEHNIAVSGATYKICAFVPEQTDDPAGIKEYFDGIAKPTQWKRVAKLQYFEYASPAEVIAGLVDLNSTNITIDDNYWAPRQQDCIHGVPRNLTRINGWNTALGYFKMRRNSANQVTIYASLDSRTVMGADVADGTSIIGTLPVGFRPPSQIYAHWGYRETPGGFIDEVTLGISEAGVIQTLNRQSLSPITCKGIGSLTLTYDIQ